ncbi:MAG: triose-phosphate isomerase [Dehalococcoidia bacterium]|nr:triose-phosphate isomerase [Dehalococcoidia bacterium]
MPATIVAGNWKMNTTLREGQALASEVRSLLESAKPGPGTTVILCPPFPYLAPVNHALDGSLIQVGAQDVFYEEKGAFTGAVSPTMLKDFCQWVIIGHSERRQVFGEIDSAVNKKVLAALRHGLRPIVCCGETLEQRNAGKAADVIRAQVQHALEGLPSLQNITIAYEPIWAIGTGVAATPPIAAEMMGGVILETLAKLHGAQSNDTSLLYGGSVTADNAASFARVASVHGALVGGASLKAPDFGRIVQAFVQAKQP